MGGGDTVRSGKGVWGDVSFDTFGCGGERESISGRALWRPKKQKRMTSVSKNLKTIPYLCYDALNSLTVPDSG